MTSKRLFFKVMREDLRHRLWMPALSALASFLVFPVVWMIFRLNIRMGTSVPEESFISLAAWVRDFLTGDIMLGGGIFAVCGALTAALTGFGFLFHKNQTDSWHSLPVSRDMLFGAGYLNGILVWMLPLTAGITLTAVMAGSFLTKYAGGVFVDNIPLGVVKRLCVLAVVFLLVYHLTLLAMMLSGNVLNTVISMLIMGFGGGTFYGLCVMLCQTYLRTYVNLANSGTAAIYATPLFSTLMIWMLALDGTFVVKILLLNLAIALALGLAAWLLYRKRPSELAEQGIGYKAVSVAFRVLAAVAAGVGGWLFFGALTNMRMGWSFFGAVLTGVLASGILDICFQMEFKAFFAHKLQMAAAVAAALVICLIFQGGLFGYDSYLPDKEEIAELGLYRTNHYYQSTSGDEDSILKTMKLQDQDAIYAFLERAARWEGSRYSGTVLYARVTLKSGKTYYRAYNVDRNDKDVVWPLITDEEYLRHSVMLDDDAADGADVMMRFYREDGLREETVLTEEERERFVAAYNQDVRENADAFLLAEGRLLTEIHMQVLKDGSNQGEYVLYIFDFMENTVRQLQQMGYEDFVSRPDSSKIQTLSLVMGWNVGGDISAERLVGTAREYYLGEKVPEADGKTQEENVSAQGEANAVDTAVSADSYWEPALLITDRAEIEEILQLCSYAYPYRYYSVFTRQYRTVRATGADGRTMEFYIGEGDLPEKYILRFGELTERR